MAPQHIYTRKLHVCSAVLLNLFVTLFVFGLVRFRLLLLTKQHFMNRSIRKDIMGILDQGKQGFQIMFESTHWYANLYEDVVWTGKRYLLETILTSSLTRMWLMFQWTNLESWGSKICTLVSDVCNVTCGAEDTRKEKEKCLYSWFPHSMEKSVPSETQADKSGAVGTSSTRSVPRWVIYSSSLLLFGHVME